MIKRVLILLILAMIVAAGFGFVWLRFTAPKPGELDGLQNGDLVFQTLASPQTLAIIFATGSLYTHTGIIKQDAKLGPMVVEAVGPVREIPLAQWLKQGVAARVVAKRMHGMTPAIAGKILEAARTHYGKPYDFLFRFDQETIYCSELVYDAFQAGAHINIGRVQRVMELNTDNFAVQKLFALRWQDHPLCQAPPTNNYTACADLILKQELITPVSIAADQKLEIIYNNYGKLAR